MFTKMRILSLVIQSKQEASIQKQEVWVWRPEEAVETQHCRELGQHGRIQRQKARVGAVEIPEQEQETRQCFMTT